MRLLLDTHVLLWVLGGHRNLKPRAKALITDASAVFVSAASLWEVAIKAALGKIDADTDALADAVQASGMHELPVTLRHAAGVVRLPMHHADPFDRLLVAQALAEPPRLLTADDALTAYGEIVILA